MEATYIVDLTDEERAVLRALVSKGKHGARTMIRAQTLLLANEGRTNTEIVRALPTSLSTVYRTRKRFVQGGSTTRFMTRRDRAAPGSSTQRTRRRSLRSPARSRRRE